MVLESNTLDYIFLQDGENGVGTPGKDGKTLYTWVKYSQNADGSNMSDSPENALYIGIAYNKDSATESTNANDYNWTKIKGEQGLPGADAYTIILSNESHTFSGTVTSAIASSTKCYIIAYKGTKQLSVTIGTISNLPEGMTAPISNNGTTNAYFSPTVTSLMTTKNGTLTIPITVDGKTFTKYFSYSLALQGNNGISATNIILSNESHTFSANASGQADATSINIDILGFTGTTQVRTQIGELSGLPTGMTMKINNNGTINTSITVSVTSSLTTSQGTVKIPITADGVTVEKSFSYALSRTGETGAQGATGRVYELSVSTLVIKKGVDNVLSPSTVTFSGHYRDGSSATRSAYSGRFKIEESTDGSLFTSKYTSSANESSKSYTPSSSNVKVIRCTLYASGGTTNALDEQSVVVLTDIDNLEIGGRNLIINSSRYRENCPFTNTSAEKDGILDLPIDVYMPCVPGETYTFQCKTDGKWGSHDTGGTGGGKTHIFVYLQTANEVGTGYYKRPQDLYSDSYNGKTGRGVWTYTIPTDYEYERIVFRFDIHSDGNTPYTVNWWDLKAELGNKATDWTPAPEDIQNQITTITDTISGVESKVNANTKSITDKVWHTDISTSINEYDGSTVKKIRDRVASTETDISGIKTTLSDVQTTVSKKADGSTVQTLSTKFATMESNFNGFKTTVSNTYTTKEDFNNLEIGGRNLARKTSNEYCAAFNSFNGNDNICPSLAHVYLKGLSVGDKVTVRLIYKYTNIVAVTGKTAAAWIQGSGNITDWTSGAFGNSKSIVLSGSGEKIIKYSFVITSDMIKNQYWNVNIRHDGIQSGSVQWKEFKVEKGNIATDWTPAPEDVEQSITNVSSQYTQLADKFNWVVKSGTSASDFTITDRMISLTSSALNIDALTTFKNSAENGSSTVINGGAIKANTITTSKLATDAIKSINYSYSSGNFSSAGTFLDLSTGLIRSKNFGIDSSGNVYLKGNIQANAGYIGGTSGWAITTNTITGNANSKIISGILQSSNYVENSTGVQVNLNTGIIKGNIEASTLAAKEAIKIYVGSTKRNVITGHLASDFFYVRIGCDLSTGNIARVKPSIILNKSTASTNVSDMITINTEALDIYANTTISGSLVANDLLTNGVINTSGNDVYCNDIMTRTGWAADRLSHGETAYSNLMSGRISFKWALNSSGVWRIYVYVDGAVVRDW